MDGHQEDPGAEENIPSEEVGSNPKISTQPPVMVYSQSLWFLLPRVIPFLICHRLIPSF